MLISYTAWLRKEVKKVVREDKERARHMTILKAETAYANHDTKGLFKCFKALKKFTPRPVPQLQNKEGEIAKTPKEAKFFWQGHFK